MTEAKQINGRLYLVCGLLAIGQFALVTSVWMLTGMIGMLATEFEVSVGTAGQVLSVFSITYAVSAPLLAIATARFNRRIVLVIVLATFVAANLMSIWAPTFELLLLSRCLAGAADGLYQATATAVAVALAPVAARGRVLALLNTGVTLALFIGVPLSTMIGTEFGWRGTFIGAGAVASVAALGLLFLLPKVETPPVASLAERVAVVKSPGVFPTLSIAFLSYMGLFSVYAFLAPILHGSAGITPVQMSSMLLAFGLATVLGNYAGGQAADKWGPQRALGFSLVALVPLLIALPLFSQSMVSAAVMLFLWGGFHYFGLSPLQLHLATLAPRQAGVALALNNSVIYLGVAAGALVGGFVVDHLPLFAFGLVGAGFKLVALIILLWMARSLSARAALSRTS